MADIDAMLAELEGRPYGQANQNQNALKTLEGLEALGELRPAEAEELARLRAGSQADAMAVGETDALYRGALQGGTFRWADEIGGMFGADKDAIRQKNATAQSAFPEAYNTGELGGGIIGGTALGYMTRGMATGPTLGGLTGTMMRGAGLGAAEGALWGAGGGKGLTDKVGQAAGYGAMGGMIGGAAPAAVAGLGAAYRVGSDAFWGVPNAVLGRASKSKAQRTVRGLLDKAKTTPADLGAAVRRAASEGQPEYRIMDALGLPGQRKASGLVRSGGAGAEELAAFLNQRQADAPTRFAGMVEDAYGFPAQTAAKGTAVVPQGYQFTDNVSHVLKGRVTSARKAAEDMVSARSATANTLYDAAREGAGPVDVRDAVSIIDRRIGPMQGANIKGDGIDARLSSIRDRLIAKPAPAGELSRELSDFDRVLGVKQDVQDAIGSAARAGRNNEVRELKKLEKALDQALEVSSEGYRKANDTFRTDTRIIDALDSGRDMSGRPRSVDVIREFQSMTPEQQQAARIGYGDKVLEDINAKQAAAPNVARNYASTNRREEAAAMTLNPETFGNQVRREDEMFGTYNRAMQGSRTADNIEDIEGAASMGPVARAILAAGNLNMGTAARELGTAISPYLTNNNEATRQLVARILMTSNPEQALAQVAKSKATSDVKRRIAESIVRAAGRESQSAMAR